MAILIPNLKVFVTIDSEQNLIAHFNFCSTHLFHVLFGPGRPIEATLFRNL
jgi:hypothetical protein